MERPEDAALATRADEVDVRIRAGVREQHRPLAEVVVRTHNPRAVAPKNIRAGAIDARESARIVDNKSWYAETAGDAIGVIRHSAAGPLDGARREVEGDDGAGIVIGVDEQTRLAPRQHTG